MRYSRVISIFSRVLPFVITIITRSHEEFISKTKKRGDVRRIRKDRREAGTNTGGEEREGSSEGRRESLTSNILAQRPEHPRAVKLNL